MEAPPSSFPTEGVLPKEETGAAKFVQANPTCDGRGVLVAIFDTGVDPAAKGLQVTSDGKPKIVDVVDCTGSGDVDTSEVRDVGEGNTVKGLTGRTLKLGDWSIPTKKVHVGLKRILEICPGPLVRRLREDRKEAFLEKHRAAVTAAQRRLAEWDAVHKAPSEAEKREKKDLEAVIESLGDAADSYVDPGPVCDCVVFHDGDKWRAVLDTMGQGDLTACTPMTNFFDERQHGTLGGLRTTKDSAALLSYALNIHEDGNVLSIACDSGSHGTHVAGIVAANFPDAPELNGVAPGAQLIAYKIGDSRLASMETGSALVRALLHAKERGCDVINMSFGESFMYDNSGRVVELMAEFVDRHGITFVSSAGNNGPALTTIGAPAGTCSSIISVGAFVSPGMMEVEYSLREKLKPTMYTWSSRGPCPDGYWGVSLVAPGGAIAPVPAWTLQGKQLMNGTSMSSPNACGGVALILSALKAAGVPHTPMSVRRAIENTAAPVPGVEPFALGHGLLQVPASVAYLKEYAGAVGHLMRISASLPGRIVSGKAARGLYIRDPKESAGVVQTTMMVRPEWHPEVDNREQVAFELQIELRCDAQWVHIPQYMVLGSQGKGFDIKVDPTGLPEGVHFTTVQGFDAKQPARGALFTLPVTCVRPIRLAPESDNRLEIPCKAYSPGAIDRHFIAVPDGATYAEFAFRTTALEGNHTLVLHALQIVPGSPHVNRNPMEFEKYIVLKPNTEIVERMLVRGGLTLEAVICKWWASLGECSVAVEVTFHGVCVRAGGALHLHAAPEPVEVHTPLRPETLTVSAKFTHLRKFYRPKKALIKAMTAERDLLPLGRQICELELTYAVEQTEKEAVKCTPRPHGLYDLLYDSPFESQLWMVFDANKQLMGSGDGLHTYDVTLSKGKHTIKLHIRHDNKALLDRLKAFEIAVDFALTKEVSGTTYPSLIDALTGGAKYTGGVLQKGARSVFHVTPPTDKVPGAKSGDFLVGVLKVADHKQEVPLLARVQKEEESEEEAKEKSEKTDEELLREAVRDVQISQLKALREDSAKGDAFDALAKELLAAHPAHVPLLREVLSKHDSDGDAEEGADKASARCRAAIAAADAVIAAAGPGELATHYGVKHDPNDLADKQVCKEMDKRKEALIEALLIKTDRFAELLKPAPSTELREGVDASVVPAGKTPHEELSAQWKLIQQWVVAKDQKIDVQVKHALIMSSHERRHGRPGAAVAELLKLAKSKEAALSKKVLGEIKSICEQMGWDHLSMHYEDLSFKLFPAKFPIHM